MAQLIDQLWNNFHELRQDIEDLLGPTNDDLPRSYAEAQSRPGPDSQEEYRSLQERLFTLRVFLQNFVDQVNDMDTTKTQLLDVLSQIHQRSDQLKRDADEFAQLRQESNQIRESAAELDELRHKTREDAVELQALRQQHEQRRNTQQITGPSVSTAPEAALDPVDPVDPFALYQAVIGVQADIHERFLNNMLDETTSAIASSAARAGAQAYISAVSAGQTEADALVAAEQAADETAAETSAAYENARAAGEEARNMAKGRGRSSPVAQIAHDTASREVLRGTNHAEALFAARRAIDAVLSPEPEPTDAANQAGDDQATADNTGADDQTGASDGAAATAIPAVSAAVPAAPAANTLTAAQLQTSLNINAAQIIRTPWQIHQSIPDGGIKIGDGTTAYGTYPALPDSLTQAVIDRVAQDFVRYFCQLNVTTYNEHWFGTFRKTTCLYRKCKSQGADGWAPQEFACATCVQGNRICVRRRWPQGPIYIAPLPQASRPAGAIPANLDYWVVNPAAAMENP
ncbi:hypothetical protein KCV07_g5837, partial [Aureobasidium melanogenum]